MLRIAYPVFTLPGLIWNTRNSTISIRSCPKSWMHEAIVISTTWRRRFVKHYLSPALLSLDLGKHFLYWGQWTLVEYPSTDIIQLAIYPPLEIQLPSLFLPLYGSVTIASTILISFVITWFLFQKSGKNPHQLNIFFDSFPHIIWCRWK